MTSFAATLFDSHSAARWPVQVVVEGERVLLQGDFPPLEFARGALTPDAPVPGVPRRLQVDGGATLETADHAAVEAVWPATRGLARFAFALESSWRAAVGAVAVVAATTALIIFAVLPRFADDVAERFPPDVERAMGEHVFASLESTWLKPSALPEDEQRAVVAKFNAFVAGEPGADQYRVVLRHAGDANAFALPGGIIVVADEMVKLAANDAELLAVLAHEIGHVRGRHALRLLLRQSGVVVLVAALAGDAVGMTVLAAALPTVLLQSGYTRQFEAEADEYAFAHLKRKNLSPQAFADIMRKLAQTAGPAAKDEQIFRYVSSHPVTAERIARAEQAAKE